uniref:Uncharacterized protein n=1 Tax=Tanacetum cinerariifolium TaxID=118510 RepID=A0A699HGL5_TANCI|nr:hypothetical protein [Tanacetum cinerariifolium]
MSEEFKASKPLSTRTISSYSLASLDSTAPLSPDHPHTHALPTPTPTRALLYCKTARMTIRAHPAMFPSHPVRVEEVMTLSDLAFHKRYRSSYETPSSSSSSLTLPVWKRYRGTSELILDTDSEGDELRDEDIEEDGKDKSQGLEDKSQASCLELTEEISPYTYKVRQSSRVYTDIPTYAPLAVPVQTPPSPEWSPGSLLVSPSSPVVHIALLVTTLSATISVDEDQFLEVGAQLELHGSILYDHTHCLDVLPTTLFKGYDRDLRELYNRSGVVIDEIFLLRYRFRSLEREQIAEERHERYELTNRVARIERRQESRGE